jgi:WD40 repeat protein
MDSTIRLWDAETGAYLKTLSGHSSSVSGLAFSPQGNQIASGGFDDTVRLWHVDTGACQRILIGHTVWVQSITYSPQGDQVASASLDETVRLWNATTGEHCGTLKGHTDGVVSVAYSPDGSLIATGSKDFTIRLWSAGTMACINTLIGHHGWVHDVMFSPGGNQLATACDETVCLWSVVKGACSFLLFGHTATVRRVGYSPKGDLLASGSDDTTVRLWHVASGQCQAVVQNFQGEVYGVAWIPSTDANYLVTGCQDGSVVKWQVIEEEEQYHVHPCWIATNGSLNVAGASIQDVRGLTPSNDRLLKQRVIVREPEDRLSGVNDSFTSQSSESSDGMELDSACITDFLDEQQDDEEIDHRTVDRKASGKRYHPYRRIA